MTTPRQIQHNRPSTTTEEESSYAMSTTDIHTIESAERDMQDAAEATKRIEAGIIAGDKGATLDALEAQERTLRQKTLAVEAAKARDERAKQAERDAQVRDVRSDIDAHKPADLLALLEAIETATRAFSEALTERNALIYEWRSRLMDAGVPTVTPAEASVNAELAPSANFPYGIFLNHKHIGLVEPQHYIAEAVLRGTEQRPTDVYVELRADLGH